MEGLSLDDIPIDDQPGDSLSTKDKIKNVQAATHAAQDDTIEVLQDTIKTGAETLRTLDEQGNQIDQMDQKLDSIDNTLVATDATIKRMHFCCLFQKRAAGKAKELARINKQRKKQGLPPLGEEEYDGGDGKEHAQELQSEKNKRMVKAAGQLDEGEKEGLSETAQSELITEKKLDVIGNLLQQEAEMAKEMTVQLDSHNKKLAKVDDKLEKVKTTIKGQDRNAASLLK